MMNDKNKFIYVGIEEEERIGICRFNLDEANNSINLNSRMRGKIKAFNW
jgi:6-phosphogluconolactonase (cycloisomerase 2 family)